MKIYRVTLRRYLGEHDGFEYYSNKKEAETRQKEINDERAEDNDIEDMDEESPNSMEWDKVQTIEFENTKQGIMSMLERYCSYPDNG